MGKKNGSPAGPVPARSIMVTKRCETEPGPWGWGRLVRDVCLGISVGTPAGAPRTHSSRAPGAPRTAGQYGAGRGLLGLGPTAGSGSRSREGGGVGRRGRPRSAPRALTTIGCAAADVTAHRPGSDRDPGRAHLFLITWEVSLAPSLLPFPSSFILFSPRKLPRGHRRSLPSAPVPIPSHPIPVPRGLQFLDPPARPTPPPPPPPPRHCSPLVANFGRRLSPTLPVLRCAEVTYSFPEVGLCSSISPPLATS